MNEELKPCPFCGGAKIKIDESNNYIGWDGRLYRVRLECQNCDMQTKSFSERSEAVDFWNTRPNIADALNFQHVTFPAMVAKVRELLDTESDLFEGSEWDAAVDCVLEILEAKNES